MADQFDYFEALDRTRVVCDTIYRCLDGHKATKSKKATKLVNAAIDSLEELYQLLGERFDKACPDRNKEDE